jgi:adenylosuccinate lyase
MNLNTLTAISPIDGRYRSKVTDLASFFSEYALIRYRLWVEVAYFIQLAKLPLAAFDDFPEEKLELLPQLYLNFNESDANKIKEIEKTTNHDLKAVEYFMREKFEEIGLGKYKEFIHFGLTSQDINNTAIPLSHKEADEQVYLPQLTQLTEQLKNLAQEWKNIPMLARTHGQTASPTRLGKEIWVFVERLEHQIKLLTQIPYAAKFGGATGNFNAHHVAYPEVHWVAFANRFIDTLGLQRSQTTTQIEHYDYLATRLDNYKRINTILLDLAKDFWHYISIDYFKQKVIAGEVGSSAMPHKVNPIDFENAEGNLGIANALFSHLSEKLPISRLQRDLTDSTVLRNLGVPLAHTIIAFQALSKGLGKLTLNEPRLARDLSENWAVVSEAIQTILRRESYPHPYEALKMLTRGNQQINQETLKNFIDALEVEEDIKEELRAIRPENYLGIEPDMRG